MKKITVLLLFILFLAISSFGQNTKHVSLSYSIRDFKLHQENSETSIIISPDKYIYSLKSDTANPALPYIGYNVLVPKTKKYAGHSMSGLKVLVGSNVLMAKNPIAIPTNMAYTPQINDETISYTQRVYPSENVEYVGANDYDEYRLLSFLVCPFEYDAFAQKLYLKEKINIDISLSDETSQSSVINKSGDKKAMRETIREMIVNPDDLEEDNVSVTGNRSNQDLTLQTGYEYVIVTSNDFKNTFQQLANWKSRKGIRAKVLTVDSIISAYSGATKQEKIKRALADIDSLSYVLLGGDTLNVPTCMCYIGYHQLADSITPADVYYSCMGTMNWDNYTNGLYGELRDSINLFPSLNVSRAPVSTIEDAQVFVNRIINYESMPDTLNWEDNILMSGTSLGYRDPDNVWHPYYVNGQSDTQIWSQKIYDLYIAPTNPSLPSWNGALTRFYDTYTDISGDGSYDFNKTNLQTELAKGYTFVDVMTHGSKISWQMEGNNYAYTYYNAKTLNNGGYTFITTNACLTNAFDYHTNYYNCLSQSFINNAQSGILAYLGTSRENWYYPRTTYLALGAEFDGLTYRMLLTDKYHRLGKATTAVKYSMMSDAQGSYSAERKIWMGLNLMGDPEMPVYLSKPKVFQNVQIRFVNDSIYVDAGTENYDICFINKSDSTDYYIARDIAGPEAVFHRLDGIYDVCITKPGYIPYTTECGDTLYLQNIALASTKTYNTNEAMIGSDVTDKIAQGPVVINNGSTIIKASQGATITKNFQVSLGAEFIIKNE